MHDAELTTANERYFTHVRNVAREYLYTCNSALIPWEGVDCHELYQAIERSLLPGDEGLSDAHQQAFERVEAALGVEAVSDLDDAQCAYIAALQRASVVFGIALGIEKTRMILGGGR